MTALKEAVNVKVKKVTVSDRPTSGDLAKKREVLKNRIMSTVLAIASGICGGVAVYLGICKKHWD